MEATTQNQLRTIQNQFATTNQRIQQNKEANRLIETQQIPSSILPKVDQIDYSKIMLTLSIPDYFFHNKGGRSSSNALVLSQSTSLQPRANVISSSNYNSQRSPPSVSQKSRKTVFSPSGLPKTTSVPEIYFKSKYLRIAIIEGGDCGGKEQSNQNPMIQPVSTRTIDLSNFKSLIILNIANCGLKSLNTLKRSKDTLRFLNASDNFLQSGFPHLPRVEELYLARNQFKKIDYLSKCKKIKVLDISYNQIQDSEEVYRVGRELDDLCAVRLQGNPIKTKDKWLLNSTVFGKHVNCTPSFSEMTLDFSQWSKCLLVNQQSFNASQSKKNYANDNLLSPQAFNDQEEVKSANQQIQEHVLLQINESLYGGRNEIVIRQRLRKALNYLDILFGEQINHAIQQMRQDDDNFSLFTGEGLSYMNTSNLQNQDSTSLIPYKSQKPMLKTQIDKLCEFRVVVKNAVGLANEEPIQDAISRVIGQNIASSSSPYQVERIKNSIITSQKQNYYFKDSRSSNNIGKEYQTVSQFTTNSNHNSPMKKSNACLDEITAELIKFQNLTQTNKINERKSMQNQGDLSPIKTDSRLDIQDYRRLSNQKKSNISSSFNFDISPGHQIKNQSNDQKKVHFKGRFQPMDLFRSSFMDTSNPPSLLQKIQSSVDRRQIKQHSKQHLKLYDHQSLPSSPQKRMIKFKSVSNLLNTRNNCYSPSQSTKSIMKRVNKVLTQAREDFEGKYQNKILESQFHDPNDQKYANTIAGRELIQIQENIKAQDLQSNPTALSTPH